MVRPIHHVLRLRYQMEPRNLLDDRRRDQIRWRYIGWFESTCQPGRKSTPFNIFRKDTEHLCLLTSCIAICINKPQERSMRGKNTLVAAHKLCAFRCLEFRSRSQLKYCCEKLPWPHRLFSEPTLPQTRLYMYIVVPAHLSIVYSKTFGEKLSLQQLPIV